MGALELTEDTKHEQRTKGPCNKGLSAYGSSRSQANLSKAQERAEVQFHSFLTSAHFGGEWVPELGWIVWRKINLLPMLEIKPWFLRCLSSTLISMPYMDIHILLRYTYVSTNCNNTGHFIMYSGITKIYDRKTAGHVVMKLVQIEGTTQKRFSHKVVFHRSSHFCC
jgi:hypothetical protein